MQVSAPVLPIRRTPDDDGAQETQALFGEVFTVYDEQGEWAWGQATLDGYVGYVRLEGLSAPVSPPTHRVTRLRTYRFSEPNLKSAPLGLISMNARIGAVEARPDGWVKDHKGGFIWAAHIAPLGETLSTDIAASAKAFLGAPYFWGGRESLGLDCSGLVQNAFGAAGRVVPRDADQQEAHFTESGSDQVIYGPEAPDAADWQSIDLGRGDLIFWPGHVTIMLDGARMIHANATHMAVTIDPLSDMADRWAKKDPKMLVRRIIRPGI